MRDQSLYTVGRVMDNEPEHNIGIPYTILTHAELAPHLLQLEQSALLAAQSAYAPYSGFGVGAAVLLDNGEIIGGSNQENAAYPSGICAERTAIYYAGARYPDAAIEALLITALSQGERVPMISPCGACRQVILEAAIRHRSYPIYLAGSENVICINDCRLLLPFAFDGSDLPSRDSKSSAS